MIAITNGKIANCIILFYYFCFFYNECVFLEKRCSRRQSSRADPPCSAATYAGRPRDCASPGCGATTALCPATRGANRYRGERAAVAADQSNIMGISLFLVCLCQLNNCNKSVWRDDRSAARAIRTHTQKYGAAKARAHRRAAAVTKASDK